MLDTEEAQAEFLLESIAKFESGRQSLVDFRSASFATKKDVPPVKFHYRRSDILLNGDKHYAIEGFRKSAKTQYVMRAFPLYCLTYPSKKTGYELWANKDMFRDRPIVPMGEERLPSHMQIWQLHVLGG